MIVTVANRPKLSSFKELNLTDLLFPEVRSPGGLWVLSLGSLKAEIKVVARYSVLEAGGQGWFPFPSA